MTNSDLIEYNKHDYITRSIHVSLLSCASAVVENATLNKDSVVYLLAQEIFNSYTKNQITLLDSDKKKVINYLTNTMDHVLCSTELSPSVMMLMFYRYLINDVQYYEAISFVIHVKQYVEEVFEALLEKDEHVDMVRKCQRTVNLLVNNKHTISFREKAKCNKLLDSVKSYYLKYKTEEDLAKTKESIDKMINYNIRFNLGFDYKEIYLTCMLKDVRDYNKSPETIKEIRTSISKTFLTMNNALKKRVLANLENIFNDNFEMSKLIKAVDSKFRNVNEILKRYKKLYRITPTSSAVRELKDILKNDYENDLLYETNEIIDKIYSKEHSEIDSFFDRLDDNLLMKKIKTI